MRLIGRLDNEGVLDGRAERWLFACDRKKVVVLLFNNNLSGDSFLAANGVNGNQMSLEVEGFQQGWNCLSVNEFLLALFQIRYLNRACDPSTTALGRSWGRLSDPKLRDVELYFVYKARI